jgi:hypothetical protein
MPDYEVFAPDDATMQLALQKLGTTFKSGKNGSTVYAVDYYGTKYLQSGTVVDGFGNTIPNMVAQPGVYANVRWMGASALGLSGVAGATIKLLAAPFYRVFFG